MTAVNQGMHVGGAVCDVEQSFDCVNQHSAAIVPCALVACGTRSQDFSREILIYEHKNGRRKK